MARRKDSGTAVIYFNTADEAMKRITPEQLTDSQRRCFKLLDKKVQADILNGVPMSVVDVESETEICAFNMQNIVVSDWAIDALAKAFLPDIRKFYENEDNVKAAKEWAAKNKRTDK